MGLFVVFEGIEGSGKTTQSKALKRQLLKAGYPVTLVQEPGGTPTGERVRRWVKGVNDVSPLAEVFLFSAARASLIESVIRPALDRGDVVICDRYMYSTLAYQGYGRGVDIPTLRGINEVATGGLSPEIVLLLDVSTDAGLARKGAADLDRFEMENQSFHRRVRQGFLELARAAPDRWLVLDSSASFNVVLDSVWNRVEPLLGRAAGEPD